MRPLRDGGKGGIRTHGGASPAAVFETAPFVHSGTFPPWIISHRLRSSKNGHGPHPALRAPLPRFRGKGEISLSLLGRGQGEGGTWSSDRHSRREACRLSGKDGCSVGSSRVAHVSVAAPHPNPLPEGARGLNSPLPLGEGLGEGAGVRVFNVLPASQLTARWSECRRRTPTLHLSSARWSASCGPAAAPAGPGAASRRSCNSGRARSAR
jgi:hypothetical protein